VSAFDLYCNGCGQWQTFRGGQSCECAICGTWVHLSENATTTSGVGLAAFHGSELDAPVGAAGAVSS
jgi:hypothetical protein